MIVKSISALTAGLMIAAAIPAFAVDGDLDPGFGNAGLALVGIADGIAGGIGVQSNGRVLICGTRSTGGPSGRDFLVARFTADGLLDDSFNFNGRVGIDFGGDDDCNGIAVQADGRIVVAGVTVPANGNHDFAIARLNDDGALDTTFGAGTGKVTLAFDLGGNNEDYANAIALQPDGKIVVAGFANNPGHGPDFAVARLLGDGTYDSTFNLTGRETVGFDLGPGNDDRAQSVAIDSAGRIVLGGDAQRTSTPFSLDFAAARLLPDGGLDANFDADGRVTVAFDLGGGSGSNDDEVLGMTLQADGRIVLAGDADISTTGTTDYDMAVARLLPNGALDAGFGSGGKTLVPFDLVPDGGDIATGVIGQANGKLVLAGYAADSADGSAIEAAVARLNTDGTPDPEFGEFGKEALDFGLTSPGVQLPISVALGPRRILVCGDVLTNISGDADIFVAGLENSLIFANGFE
ncbi:MAG: hypothetical protein WB784_06355 [Rhodanobacteraceae bacterium]